MLLHALSQSPLFQSTPSGWRETSAVDEHSDKVKISIHSLRVEGDEPERYTSRGSEDFNPLPPGGGRR